MTTLRCSLELSLDEGAERQQEAVTTALEQTENVIEMIQLMREYVEIEPAEDATVIAVMPILRSVVEELSSLAEVGQVRMRIEGTCRAELLTSEQKMRNAFRYLISAMIERSAGGEIELLLSEAPSGWVLRIGGRLDWGLQSGRCGTSFLPAGVSETSRAMGRMRVAVAARWLESAGVVLVFDEHAPEFILRMP